MRPTPTVYCRGYGSMKSEFEGAGRLLMVVGADLVPHHFQHVGGKPWKPSEVNAELARMHLGIRVDSDGKPFEVESCPQKRRHGSARSAVPASEKKDTLLTVSGPIFR